MADDSKLSEFLMITESGDIEGATQLLALHNNNLDAAINAFFSQNDSTSQPRTQRTPLQANGDADVFSNGDRHIGSSPPPPRPQSGTAPPLSMLNRRVGTSAGPSIMTTIVQKTWSDAAAEGASRSRGVGSVVRSALSAGSNVFWRLLGYTQEDNQQAAQQPQQQETKVQFYDLGAEENARFVTELMNEYKYLLFPRIFAGSYARALEEAARLKRALLVVLHAPEHADTPVFMRRVFCDSTFRRFVNQRCVVWITSVARPDGSFLADALRASSHFPAFALLIPDEPNIRPERSNPLPPGHATVRFERGGVPPPLSRAAVPPHRALDYYYKRDSQRRHSSGAESKSNENSPATPPRANQYVGGGGSPPQQSPTDTQVEELDDEAVNAFPWVELGLTAASLTQVPNGSQASPTPSPQDNQPVDAASHEPWLSERRIGRVFVEGLVAALRSLLDAYDEERRQHQALAQSRADAIAATGQAARNAHLASVQSALRSVAGASASIPAPIAPLASGHTDSVMSAQDAEFAQAMQEDLERIRARRMAEQAERERVQVESMRQQEEQIVAAQHECSTRRREHGLQQRLTSLEERRSVVQAKLRDGTSSKAQGSSNSNVGASHDGDLTIGVKFPSGKRVSLTVNGKRTTLNDLLEIIECSEAAVTELYLPVPPCTVHELSHPDSHLSDSKASSESSTWHNSASLLHRTAPYLLATAMPRSRFMPSQLDTLVGDIISNRTLLIVEVFLSASSDDVEPSLAQDELTDEQLAKRMLALRAQRQAAGASDAATQSDDTEE